MTNIIYALLSLVGAQILVWFQLNGQFVWDKFRDHHTIVVIAFAFPVSWLFINYQRYAYVIFDQSLWSMRLVGYGVGMVIFLILTWYLTGETLNLKNGLCLLLSFGIILIQAFIK